MYHIASLSAANLHFLTGIFLHFITGADIWETKRCLPAFVRRSPFLPTANLHFLTGAFAFYRWRRQSAAKKEVSRHHDSMKHENDLAKQLIFLFIRRMIETTTESSKCLQGRVKFPIGGTVRERAGAGFDIAFKSGFGEIPKPTV